MRDFSLLFMCIAFLGDVATSGVYERLVGTEGDVTGRKDFFCCGLTPLV